MKRSLSHRWRIALASACVAAILFAIVLFIAQTVMARMERHAAQELLDAPMSEVLNSLKSGEPLDEEVGAQERVTVIVFDPKGKPRFRSGSASVSLWHGDGEASVAGRDLIYRSTEFNGSTIVAAADWTGANSRLARIRWIFLLLLIPLAACVGVSAYVAAGLMYRSLRHLASAAQAMAAEGKIRRLDDPLDSDLSPLVQELNSLLERIQAEVERQERLVSDVAHDLRTPLTVIRGRLETALLQNVPTAFPGAMRTAIREAERLSTMADSILQSSQTRVRNAPIELSSISTLAIGRWRELFEERGAKLNASLDSCWAAISPEEWTSILDNLLDNAFKYGGDVCSVSLVCGEEVRLVVSDNGAGVPDSERERVFERFARLDSSRGSDGHGLGLYLCASMVKAGGGTIAIESEKGHFQVVVSLPASAGPKD